MFKKLKQPFYRTGSKNKICEKVINDMPPHRTYVEPFIGGGVVFCSKSKAERNVINDLDKNIYHLWVDFKNTENIDFEFIPGVNADRETFFKFLSQTEFKDDKERLYRNLFLNKYSFGGNMSKIGYKDIKKWRPIKFTYLKRHFDEYKELLKDTTILNEDYKKIINIYDSEDTFFYLDPPYSKNLRYWGYGLPFITNKELLDNIRNIRGKFMLSYDDTPENRELFKDFYIKDIETHYGVKSKGLRAVKEILITNYII